MESFLWQHWYFQTIDGGLVAGTIVKEEPRHVIARLDRGTIARIHRSRLRNKINQDPDILALANPLEETNPIPKAPQAVIVAPILQALTEKHFGKPLKFHRSGDFITRDGLSSYCIFYTYTNPDEKSDEVWAFSATEQLEESLRRTLLEKMRPPAVIVHDYKLVELADVLPEYRDTQVEYIPALPAELAEPAEDQRTIKRMIDEVIPVMTLDAGGHFLSAQDLLNHQTYFVYRVNTGYHVRIFNDEQDAEDLEGEIQDICYSIHGSLGTLPEVLIVVLDGEPQSFAVENDISVDVKVG